MTVFGLFIFLMMLVVAGMAVDLMRHETTRSRLQATLDRAVLAAADLDQREDAQAVVEDHFRAAGLGDRLTDVQTTVAMNSRTASATAATALDTFFMDLVGVETLEAPASGTAEESVNDIEIVLVLDVSGSMGSNNRIVNLRAAAREFVQTVLAGDDERRIAIAIVPFNAQVNVGPTVFNGLVAAGYNVAHRHGVANSFCIDMPAAAFGSATLSPTAALPQAGFFDGATGTTQNHAAYVAPQPIAPSTANMACRTETQNIVRLPSQDVALLRSQIQGLTAEGNTSITMGMKWGMTLLDPGSRSLLSRMIGPDAPLMPQTLRDRPFDYERDNTLKVVVLMTDGEHVASRYLENGYRTETSNLWRTGSGSGATWSAFFDRGGTNLDYWVPSVDGDAGVSGINGAWMAAPHNDTDADGGGSDTDTDGPGPPVRLAWHQVWQEARMSWVAWTLYARALGTSNSSRTSLYNTWMGNFTGDTAVSTMNSTLQQSCAQARANGIIVYGIAFEAPSAGRTQIAACASSPAHYYNAQGLEIATVFRAIAGNIDALRLID